MKELPPYDKENSFYYDCDYTQLKGNLLEKQYVRLYHPDYYVSESLGWVKSGESVYMKDFPITYQYNGVKGKVKMKKANIWEDVLGDRTVIYYWDNNYHITKIKVIKDNLGGAVVVILIFFGSLIEIGRASCRERV